MARRNRKYKLGLVGDSTAEHYPLEDLEDQDIVVLVSKDISESIFILEIFFKLVESREF